MQLLEVWIRNSTGSASYAEKVARLHASKFGNVQGKYFHICWSFCCSRSNTLLCPEGSFLVPEIGILFGDAVGASLVDALRLKNGLENWLCECRVFSHRWVRSVEPSKIDFSLGLGRRPWRIARSIMRVWMMWKPWKRWMLWVMVKGVKR